MKFNFLLKSFIVGVVIILFASCDRDINEIGSGVIGDDHYGLNKKEYEVVAYNQALGPVQTNDLTVNQFGYYNNPVFGKTKASFVTQLSLATANPAFYHPVIDSVYLYVPYYSTLQSTDSDTGDSTYKLDSIYPKLTDGSPLPKIKLSVYESDYTFEDYEPTSGMQLLKRYYSNQKADFDAKIANGGNRLNNDNKSVFDHTVNDNSQNDKFTFSEKQIKFYKKDALGNAGYTDVASRKAPGMFLNLDPLFFTSKIMNAPSGKLFNNSVFKDYFKGLYFKVEEAAGYENQGSLAMMNFTNGVITIVYKDETSATDATIVRKEFNINLSGHSVNLLENDNNFPGYVPPNATAGDANLYLKGGNGSMAIIDLFGGKKNDNATDLNDMRTNNWMINEANLTFYINQAQLGSTAPEPNRIYLYDLTHNRPIVDFYTDFTTSAHTKYNKSIHGGILLDQNSKVVDQTTGARGTKYRIKLTNYLRNLVKFGGSTVDTDSTNVRLGLVVTENILDASGYYLNSPFTTTSDSGSVTTKYIPKMSVLNPLGTILYGSNIPVTDPNYDKRIKLEVYYTKPD